MSLGFVDFIQVKMDLTEDNTAVIRMMGEFEAFIARDIIKKQKIEQIAREKEGNEILTRSYLTKLKNDMEVEKVSHKRSRMELESTLSKDRIQKEQYSERVNTLTQQLEYISKQEDKKRKEINELQTAKDGMRSQYEQQIFDLRKQKLDLMTAHQELKLECRSQISELTHILSKKNSDIALLQTDLEGVQTQLQHQMRRGAEASSNRRALEQYKSELTTAHQTIRELQLKLSNQEGEASIAKAMCNAVKGFVEMEKENKQLKSDVEQYRDLSTGKMLADEKVLSLEGKLARAELNLEEFNKLQVEHEVQQSQLSEWESCCNIQNIKTPMELASRLAELQQKELVMLGKQGMLVSSSNVHQQAYKSATDKLASTSSRLLEVEMKNRQLEELAKRLQKRLILLTKERDSMHQVLNSYDNELLCGKANPKITKRLQQTIHSLQAYHKQVEELEGNVRAAQETSVKERLISQQLKAKIEEMKEQLKVSNATKPCASVGSTGQQVTSHSEVKTAKEKVYQIELENQKLLERLEILETHMEQRALQGDYDPTKYKVIHMKFNPDSRAKQQKVKQMEKLHEECDRLRRRVLQLESTGASGSEELSVVVPVTTKDVQELQKEIKACELRNQRLKEVFATKIQEFREACYRLTGYQIDNPSTYKYCLKSMYAERPDDVLLFQSTSSGEMQLLANTFSSTLADFITMYLQQQQSIPAFLSNITLDLFSKQTSIITVD